MSEEGIKKAMGMLDQSTRRALGKRTSLTRTEGVKPGRSVAFIRNDKNAIADARMKGYSPILASENKDLEIPAADKQPDGTFVLGDTIAMEIPTKLKEKNHQDLVAHGDRKLSAIVEKFRVDGEKAGVKTFKEGPNELAEAAEQKQYSEVGRRLFAMGASFDKDGNLVKEGKVIAAK